MFYIGRKAPYGGWTRYADRCSDANPLRKLQKDGECTYYGWSFWLGFSSTDDAIDCIAELRDDYVSKGHVEFCVFDEKKTVIWKERGGWQADTCVPQDNNPQEEKMYVEPDIQQPLVIKRDTLIGTLQANLDAETKKRTDADADRAANRAKIAAEIHKFSDDELVEFFSRNIGAGSTLDFAQWAEKARETGQFKPASVNPTTTESSLEKYVRVLNLASNDTIEVTPNDPVYPLL